MVGDWLALRVEHRVDRVGEPDRVGLGLVDPGDASNLP
jgi:hypothetical protein